MPCCNSMGMTLRSVWCFLLLTVFSGSPLPEEGMLNELLDCSENYIPDFVGSTVFVSTLDGRVSALNAHAGGMLMWNIDTGPGALLSSSIHKLELTNNGQWVRMIPSLSGGLYKFNGVNMEMLPVSADLLLQSSSFLSDGLVISGGRETRIYSVALDTGELLYECSMNGCDNFKNISENILVIQRHTQTVRAIDIHTGSERWNFSVGQHYVKLRLDTASCHFKNTEADIEDYDIKAIIPEGLVYAVKKTQRSDVLWKHKFSSPIVSVWRLEHGTVRNVNLFQENTWSRFPENSNNVAPVLYLGMHQKQLYIQECISLQDTARRTTLFVENEWVKNPQIPWDPVPVTSTALGLVSRPPLNDVTSDDDGDDAPTTALSVLYASEYVNGNGYYLFDKNMDFSNKSGKQCTLEQETNISGVIDSDGMDDPHRTPTHIIIVSAWYWWGEFLMISFATAVFVNVIITQRVLQMLQIGIQETGKKEIIFVEKRKSSGSSGVPETSPFTNYCEAVHHQTSEFISRYVMDFEPVQCLGKGGFGVVFEAKNKIDDCNYAIKRIALPNSLDSRDRVLREVKALAKLEHQHIVRYFNAWMECPPSGWQERQDSVCFKTHNTESRLLDAMTEQCVQSVNANSTLHSVENTSLLSQKRNFNNDLVNTKCARNSYDESNSFIVFEDSQFTNTHTEPDKMSMDHDEFTADSSVSAVPVSKMSAVSRSQASESCSEEDCSVSVCDNITKPPTRMYLYIQMQLCLKKSLREWLYENVTNRDKDKLLQMFEQIVQAVEYIHLEGLIHRDLKPSNIFFSMYGQIKVGDFGLVTAMAPSLINDIYDPQNTTDVNDKHTAQVGTQLYMSPEQVKGLPYDYKVDIYSLGVILFELLYPFSTQMERSNVLLKLRKNCFPEIFKQEFQNEYELLCLMLSHEPENRPTTFGIRARSPLSDKSKLNKDESVSSQWHFALPSQSRNSSNSSLSCT